MAVKGRRKTTEDINMQQLRKEWGTKWKDLGTEGEESEVR
jgi:hypothetical protein